LVDLQWLFPEAAEVVVRAHDQFLFDMPGETRRLTSRELHRYGLFPIGWRTIVEVSGKQLGLDVLLGVDIPFSEPKIAISSEDYHLIWPHVEKGGLLCLRTSADVIDHSAGVNLTSYYLDEAKLLIRDSLEGKSREDFVSEFGSYWRRWIDVRKSGSGSVWMLSKTGPPSRCVYSATFGAVHLITDSLEEGMHWARSYFKKEDIKRKRFKPAAFLWIDRPLMPSDYPKNNRNVANLAKSSGYYDMLLSLVPDKLGDPLRVVLGFQTPNGPALGAVQLNEPIESKSYKKKPVYSRIKGRRPQSVNSIETKKRYFSTKGKAAPMKVQRINREWIFERGGNGINSNLDGARVCLIGCGSLGAQVAKYLVQSGIHKLVLVDPDTLSWDNIGRHLIGAGEIRKPKTSGLKSYLENHFPAMLEIEAQPYTWQQLITGEERKNLVLDSDIIVSTIGNWDAEAALNHAFNSFVHFPPIIFGWTEPYGVAGHAISITGLGGCLSCGMTQKGKFNYAISQWAEQKHLRRAPACGDTYQPYGAIDIAPIQSMIAKAAIDLLLDNGKVAVHHTWIGRLADVEIAGGTVWRDAADYYGDMGLGYRLVEKPWSVNQSCRYNHGMKPNDDI